MADIVNLSFTSSTSLNIIFAEVVVQTKTGARSYSGLLIGSSGWTICRTVENEVPDR